MEVDTEKQITKKARIIRYDAFGSVRDFGRKPGVISLVESGDDVHVDGITMPQGWKIGTTVDATFRNDELLSVKVSREQEIDRTQEGLI